MPTEKNFAFIDGQNLNLGVKRLGWPLDFRRFRVYLKEKYHVETAYLFIGFLPENQLLYTRLQEYGYRLVFKVALKKPDGTVKGNVDAELVLQAMIDVDTYGKAVIVTSDGDFACLVSYLYGKGKVERVISPHESTCSVLLRKAAREKIVFISNLRKKLEYKGKKKNTA